MNELVQSKLSHYIYKSIAGWLGLLLLIFTSCIASANAPLTWQDVTDLKKEKLELPTLEKIEVGFDGTYRVGSLTKVYLTFRSQQTHHWIFELSVNDADGNITTVTKGEFIQPVDDAPTIIDFDIQVGRYPLSFDLKMVNFTPELYQEWRKVSQKDSQERSAWLDQLPIAVTHRWTETNPKHSIPQSKTAWLEIGSKTNLSSLAATIKDESLRPVIVNFPNPNQISLAEQDYRSFAGIAINGTSVFTYNELLHRSTSNLVEWVHSGGNLLLFFPLTKNEDLPEGFEKSPLRALLPGEIEGNKPHTNFTLWENFLGTDEQLVINEQLRRNPPLIPVLENIKGKVLLADGDTPLVIEHQLGLGRVVTCLVDLNAEPWRNWKKRDELLQRLIPWHITTDAEAKFASSSSSLRLGYDDMAGQFVTALGTFPSVRKTPFWVLMGAALVFGVVWYFVQSTLLKTWSAAARLIIAAVILTASTLGFAALVGGFGSAGNLLANSAQVVDYSAAQGEYQGQSWLSVLSNTSRKINLEATVNTASNTVTATGSDQPDQQLEWLGLPGKGWGGLDAPLATWTQGGEPYQIHSYGAAVDVTGLTLTPDLTKSFHERWRQTVAAAPPEPLVSHPGESLPRGSLKSELPFALTDAILLYNNWGVELGTVSPGQLIDLDQVRGRVVSAATTITGKRVKPTEAAQSYDRANTDVPQILRLMLLYRAAGGTRYTGLFSRAWPLLDQSSSLTETQALVLGRGPSPVKWQVGASGEALQPLEPASDVCWYRLWLPVTVSDQAYEAPQATTLLRLPK
jgi:hypothetical protein